MTIKQAGLAFLLILVLCAGSLRVASNAFVRRAVPVEETLASAREAMARGETDLAWRKILKGVTYSGEPAPFLAIASGDPPLESYLKGIDRLRERRLREAEDQFARAAESDSPLLAVRARIRLQEMRYGTGVPNAGKIPF